MSKTATNEFLVRYMADWDDHQSVVESSCKSWNRVAINQLKRKIDTYENVLEDRGKRTRSFEVGFQNGSKAYFLYVPKDISIFDLHTQIRETFVDGIKEHENISFNVLGLEESLQKALVGALSSSVHLCQWKYPKYGKKAKRNRKTKKNFGFYSSLDGKILEEIMSAGEAIAEGTNLARTLASTPTNHMQSKDLVEAARTVSKRLKTPMKFIGENKLKEMGAGSFLSVIQGTKGSDGGIVHLRYRTRKKDPLNIAIVGKGVVFDTGGYDVKTDGYMDGMHRDMTGAAVSLSLFQALVRSKPKCNIDLYLAVAENLISETASKPNDVVIAMDGTSIEIKNTDAEGRMVLADTILYAKQNEKTPDLILDYATLTGAAVDAIDNRYSCIFSNDDIIAQEAVYIGAECGERVWNFPTNEDFMDTLYESEVADISQCTTSNNAEHIYAACFLKHFIGDTPWVHVDLSAEVCDDGGLGLVNTEVTGFGVRWGFEFISKYIKENNE